MLNIPPCERLDEFKRLTLPAFLGHGKLKEILISFQPPGGSVLEASVLKAGGSRVQDGKATPRT